MDDVRGYFLWPPHTIKPAAVSANKNVEISSFKSSENIQRKMVGLTDLFQIINSPQLQDNMSLCFILSYILLLFS